MSSLYRTGYRRLLKSAYFAFAGDASAISTARVELRKHFFENRNVFDATQLVSLSRDVDDIEEILRHRIVQAVKNERGNFGKLIYL
jgi:hypothetical protein